MADRPGPAYGTPNFDLIGRWLRTEPADDGPFWALNLMRYHDEARYADGTAGVSGREADDAYAPLGPLAAIGAMVAFVADVAEQPHGQPAWHRVGIVRYPTRAAFFAMQQRDDFKAQHVHKEAGMEFTIVMACLPTAHEPVDRSVPRALAVTRGAPPVASGGDLQAVVAFDVEGVIVGDDRTFDRAQILALPQASSRDALDAWAGAADEAHVLLLRPSIDRLVPSIEDPPPTPGEDSP